MTGPRIVKQWAGVGFRALLAQPVLPLWGADDDADIADGSGWDSQEGNLFPGQRKTLPPHRWRGVESMAGWVQHAAHGVVRGSRSSYTRRGLSGRLIGCGIACVWDLCRDEQLPAFSAGASGFPASGLALNTNPQGDPLPLTGSGSLGCL